MDRLTQNQQFRPCCDSSKGRPAAEENGQQTNWLELFISGQSKGVGCCAIPVAGRTSSERRRANALGRRVCAR